MHVNREQTLQKRIRILTCLFILGLIVSGATAIPLRTELEWLADFTGARHAIETRGTDQAPAWAVWLVRVESAMQVTASKHPFLFYGTDWLAFGHFVIAIAFIGAWRDPVRNCWLFDFGLIACVLVVPYALVLGAIRGIPLWWRLVDGAFGVIGFIPLWYCRQWTRELSQLRFGSSRSDSSE